MNRLLSILAVFGIASGASQGCGLDWTLPQAHFNGVDEQGYVAYWEKIGEVDLGDGLVIPVHINFNSHRETISPILGKGWIVALLESHIEPVDDNCMRVIMPDGWTFTFLRNGNTETWRGNSGWIGETKDTIFTIAAPCGWKIKFDQGKIQEILTNKNRSLIYKYNGGLVTEINEGNKIVIKADKESPLQLTLQIGDSKSEICWNRRPRIFGDQKQNRIIGFDDCVGTMRAVNGEAQSFLFEADDKINPTLKINRMGISERTFTWDPVSKLLLKDGIYSYSTVPAENIRDSAHIIRKDEKERVESWYNDVQNGVETTQDLDGIETTVTKFAGAGVLDGDIRKVEKKFEGKLTESDHYSYDENGNQIEFSQKNGSGNSILIIQKQIISPTLFNIKYITPGNIFSFEVPNGPSS